ASSGRDGCRPAEFRVDVGRGGVDRVGWTEWRAERECLRGRAEAGEALDPGETVERVRQRSGRHPPEREVRLDVALEPFAPTTEDLNVGGGIGEVPQGLDRLPRREVDDEERVVGEEDVR